MLDRLEQGMENDRQKNIKFGNALKKAFQEDVVIPTISSVIPILGGLAMSDGGLRGVKILPTIANIMASQARKQVLPAMLGATVYEDAYNKNKDKSRWFNFTDSNDKTYGEKAATFLKGLALNSGIQAANLATRAVTDKLSQPVSSKLNSRILKKGAANLDKARDIDPLSPKSYSYRLNSAARDIIKMLPLDTIRKKYDVDFVGNEPYIYEPDVEPNFSAVEDGKEAMLGEVLANPTFNEAYPELAKNVRVVPTIFPDGDDRKASISVTPDGRGILQFNQKLFQDENLKTKMEGKKGFANALFHEVDHGISRFENTDIGANPKIMPKILTAYRTALNDEISKWVTQTGLSPDVITALDDAEQEAISFYRQRRNTLTDEERKRERARQKIFHELAENYKNKLPLGSQKQFDRFARHKRTLGVTDNSYINDVEKRNRDAYAIVLGESIARAIAKFGANTVYGDVFGNKPKGRPTDDKQFKNDTAEHIPVLAGHKINTKRFYEDVYREP